MGAIGFAKAPICSPRLTAVIVNLPSCIFFILLSFSLFRFLFYALPVPPLPPVLIFPAVAVSGKAVNPASSKETLTCDYSKGKWLPDSRSPLYNDSCSTIKHGRNCTSNGRADTDYLYWRWKPDGCSIPRFEPEKLLHMLENKHLAFVGDSMARNQLESLICMLATASTPDLLFKSGDDDQFRRWLFASHNLTVSLYWSPFLVKGVEKSKSDPNNKLYLDYIDEKWASEMASFDVVVLSAGHWYLIPGVYYEGDDRVLGCHICSGLNATEVGFYDALRKALQTSLATIKSRRRDSRRLQVILITFPAAHFEGDWDKFGACPKTKPFQEGEKDLDSFLTTMKQIVVDEIEAIKPHLHGTNIVADALDVTKLSLMRPDGHPGPYVQPFPFKDGVKDRLQNDCSHWCLPGPIDTWNEILLELVSKHRSYGGQMS